MSQKVYGIYPNKSLVEVKTKVDTENMIMDTAEIVIDPVTKEQYKKRVLSKADYDALRVKDPNTEYLILDEIDTSEVADKVKTTEITERIPIPEPTLYVGIPITKKGLYSLRYLRSGTYYSFTISIDDLSIPLKSRWNVTGNVYIDVQYGDLQNTGINVIAFNKESYGDTVTCKLVVQYE